MYTQTHTATLTVKNWFYKKDTNVSDCGELKEYTAF